MFKSLLLIDYKLEFISIINLNIIYIYIYKAIIKLLIF